MQAVKYLIKSSTKYFVAFINDSPMMISFKEAATRLDLDTAVKIHDKLYTLGFEVNVVVDL